MHGESEVAGSAFSGPTLGVKKKFGKITVGNTLKTEMDPRVLGALKFIESSPIQIVSIDATAAALCISASRLRHLFKEHMGVSFHQYLMAVRLSKAHDLIHDTDHPVIHITRLIGGQDLSHFTRDYKRAYGVTPGAHRRKKHNALPAMAGRVGLVQ